MATSPSDRRGRREVDRPRPPPTLVSPASHYPPRPSQPSSSSSAASIPPSVAAASFSSSVEASVARTALDALNAKRSALRVGYDPVRPGGDVYSDALDRMAVGAESSSSSAAAAGGAAGEEAGEGRPRPRPKPKVRRQTPLINAGYAVRMRAVGAAVAGFVAAHSSPRNGEGAGTDAGAGAGAGQTGDTDTDATDAADGTNVDRGIVNVVSLGCGLDVLGIWARSLVDEGRCHLRLFEVDCAENCALKARALVEGGMVTPVHAGAARVSAQSDEGEAAENTDCDGGSAAAKGSSSSVNEGGCAEEEAEVGAVVLRGRIVLPRRTPPPGSAAPQSASATALEAATEAKGTDYVLLSADLRSSSSLRRALAAERGFDPSRRPTLVISELVLAYLGRGGADDLLRYASADLLRASGSALVAYEPMGPPPPPHSSVGGVDLVLRGYAEDYFGRFRSKLNRGRHDFAGGGGGEGDGVVRGRGDAGGGDDEDTSSFRPLGTDRSDVLSRLVRCGFSASRADCADAGTAAAAYSSMSSSSPKCSLGGEEQPSLPPPSPSPPLRAPPSEYFDEHAALTLHLRCYALVCAFAAGTDEGVMRRVCPWRRPQAIIHPSPATPRTAYDPSWMAKVITIATRDGKEVRIRPIRKSDEERVRDLFRNAHSDLSDRYKAVRKMIKTALKTDLSSSGERFDGGSGSVASGALGDVDAVRDAAREASSGSAVLERYALWGGGFWVAIGDGAGDGDCDVAKSDEDDQDSLIGCVGVRPCHSPLADTGPTFEIVRLAVDGKHRGRGVAQALLEEAVVDFAALCGGTALVATAPSVAASAGRFYSFAGFRLERERKEGAMVLQTFVRRIDGCS